MEHTKMYKSYMRSDAWKEKRKERLTLDKNCCVMCERPNKGKDGKEVDFVKIS